MCHIHDIFYILLLDSIKSTSIPPHGLSTMPPIMYIKEDHKYFEVQDIFDSHHVRNRLEYLIKWKGYPGSDNSWKLSLYITACGLVKEFHP